MEQITRGTNRHKLDGVNSMRNDIMGRTIIWPAGSQEVSATVRTSARAMYNDRIQVDGLTKTTPVNTVRGRQMQKQETNSGAEAGAMKELVRWI